jgi:hypothetical protein
VQKLVPERVLQRYWEKRIECETTDVSVNQESANMKLATARVQYTADTNLIMRNAQYQDEVNRDDAEHQKRANKIAHKIELCTELGLKEEVVSLKRKLMELD